MKGQNEPYVPNAPPPYPGEAPVEPIPVTNAPLGQPPPSGFYPVVPPASSLDETASYPKQPPYVVTGCGPPDLDYHPPLYPIQVIPLAGPTTYVTPPAQVTVVQVQQFGPDPIQMTCGKCGATIMTSTKPQTGTLTWIICGGLCLLGCWLGCCLIPFCVDAFQDIEHTCPNCKAKLGTFRRL